MNISYKLIIPEPQTHYATVILTVNNISKKELDFFMPSWSPGSYLMREYARNVRNVIAESDSGKRLMLSKVDKSTWRVESEGIKELRFKYEVYCHELTVRTSHIDASHAFIHGPSFFVGLENYNDIKAPIELEIEMNPNWSKITTTLKDISDKRDRFLYQADDYDHLLDCPIEIGCHETDGFMFEGKPHEIASYGHYIGNKDRLKKDIETLVEHISKTVGEIPYERYLFINHFCPRLYGGLEHSDSTVLQYDSFSMSDKKDYNGWLELVAHEYFHLWNVKRIRPKELGPFDYKNEAYTRMHWLTEGLTSYVDQLFIYRTGFISLEEYLELMKKNINSYLKIPGKKYHSLEDASFDTWIKLYRADENHNNSSISYYLKGGLVFFVFNIMLTRHDISIVEFIRSLWRAYKDNSNEGLCEDDVFKIIEDLTSHKTMEEFKFMIKSVEDIDFGTYFKEVGVEIDHDETKLELGATVEFKDDCVYVKSVREDSAAHRYGLNAGDEIIALEGQRLFKKEWESLMDKLEENKVYHLTISRNNSLTEVKIMAQKGIKLIKELKVTNSEKAQKLLKGTLP